IHLGAFHRRSSGNAPSRGFQEELEGASTTVPLLLASLVPSQCGDYLGCQKNASITAPVPPDPLPVASQILVLNPNGRASIDDFANVTVPVFQPDGVTPSEFIPEPAPAFLVAAGLLLGIWRLNSTAAESAP